MEITGTLEAIYKDALNGGVKAQFAVENGKQALIESEKYRGKRLRITVKQYRNRRSLDANAYLWALLEKMADALDTDKDSLYIEALGRYGVFTHVIVKDTAVERFKAEYRLVKNLGHINAGSQEGTQLQCYYGSSTYDTKEMSRLIDGVVSEAKAIGIETETLEEIERMKKEWNVEIAP